MEGKVIAYAYGSPLETVKSATLMRGVSILCFNTFFPVVNCTSTVVAALIAKCEKAVSALLDIESSNGETMVAEAIVVAEDWPLAAATIASSIEKVANILWRVLI